MTTSLYIQCIAMFIGGQALDLFLMKIPELRTLWAKSNESFSWKRYWQSDWNVIIGTLVLCAICVIGLDQIVQAKPNVINYIKWLFVAIGGFGSSVIVSKWGSAKKYILDIIDKKTNIADGK